MQPNERTTSRWTRWIGALVGGAIGALGSLAQRVGAPTLLGVPVSAAILTRVVAVRPEQSLDEVAQLFVAGRHDLLPVLAHGKPVAVVSKSDIAAGLEQSGPHAPLAAAPSHHIVTVAPSDSLAHVLERLDEQPEAVAVIVDHGGPVGLITAEALRAYLGKAERGEA